MVLCPGHWYKVDPCVPGPGSPDQQQKLSSLLTPIWLPKMAKLVDRGSKSLPHDFILHRCVRAGAKSENGVPVYRGTRFWGFCRISFHIFWQVICPTLFQGDVPTHFLRYMCPIAETCSERDAKELYISLALPSKTDPEVKQGQRWRPVGSKW
jgi:hypothetical protein